jgi:uncharacterized membrane protein YoaK (UPF0700 family)
MSETTAVDQPGALGPDLLTTAAVSLTDPLVRALLALTFTTGLVDATSYLGLGHVFTANQTGNIVLLAAGIAGSGNLSVVAPLVSLGSFVAGAGVAGIVTRRTGARHLVLISRALAIEVSLLGIAAIFAAAFAVKAGAASGYIVIALMALAMGVRSGTVARFGGAELALSMLVGTLAALAADLRFTGGASRASVRRAAAVLAMFSGAVAGSLLLKTSLSLPLAVAAGVGLATWLIYVSAMRRHP